MLCKIADLFVEVPEVGGIAPHMRDYLWEGQPDAEIFHIKEEDYDYSIWPPTPKETICFWESAYLFYQILLDNDGMMFHAAAVGWKGRAYLFSGPSGTGKSTHRKLWQELYGEDAITAFNDDKPPLRFVDGKWYAYGAPWNGKSNIQKNVKFPLAGICFLKQGPENRIRKMSSLEAISYLTGQTVHKLLNEQRAAALLKNVDSLIKHIPIFLLECTPTTDAAKLSSETMSKAADEAGL